MITLGMERMSMKRSVNTKQFQIHTYLISYSLLLDYDPLSVVAGFSAYSVQD
jgi:hypothetical protein